MLKDIFPFDKTGYTKKTDILHDWLFILMDKKITTYHTDPVMFRLYTTYIDGNPQALQIHMDDLFNSLSEALDYHNMYDLRTIMQAFSTFSSPKYADTWTDQTESEFESLWKIMKPGLEQLLD